MKLKYTIIATMLINMLCYSQTYNIDHYYFPNKARKDVKMITEKTFSKWKTVSFFDKDGFLLRRVNYQKNIIRADYRYEYLRTDTLVQITETNSINNTEGSFLISKYYFNPQRECYKYEVYSSRDLEVPHVIDNNFMYKDDLLQSYDHSVYTKKKEYLIISKVNNIYSDKGQKIQEQEYQPDVQDNIFGYSQDTTYRNFVYNEKGQLVDCIVKSTNERSAFTGVICWSRDKMNMIYYRYSHFDKRGNWRKNYFITEKGKRFCSKRKIEYW